MAPKSIDGDSRFWSNKGVYRIVERRIRKRHLYCFWRMNDIIEIGRDIFEKYFESKHTYLLCFFFEDLFFKDFKVGRTGVARESLLKIFPFQEKFV